MKIRQLIVLTLILLSSGTICHAQNYFVNTYGLFSNPCFSIVSTDGCFFSAATANGGGSLLAFKTDTAGNILWSRQISIPDAPVLLMTDITQAADGGYLLLANHYISGIANTYQTVIKLDLSGNFLWTRSYYSLSADLAYAIIKNNDNGFMFAGGGCEGKNYVFKCNAAGAVVWQKGFTPGPGDAFAIATHDYDRFVISGYTGTDLVFFEIDAQGNLFWQSVVSLPNLGIVTLSLKPTLDGGYAGTGQIWLNAGEPNRAFIIKINPSGLLSWMKIYNVVGGSVGNDITENSDSSIIMVGFSSTVSMNGLMVKTDNNGNLLLAKGEINQQSYSEYNSVNTYQPDRILLSGQCQNGFLPTFIAVTDNSFSSFCNIADLQVSDSVPGVLSAYLANTPVNLSFLTDSLTVSAAPYLLTKNVLCATTVIPTVSTGSATAINLSSATLHGAVMPAGDTLAAFFEYGTTASYGSTVPALPDTVSGNYTTSVSVALTSLSPNTVYHYRCSATGGTNSYYGHDSVFITCSPTVPVITGNDSLCPNSGYYTYLTQPGFQDYLWEISAGGTITYGEGTPELQVTWQQSGDQWVSVSFSDSAGCTPVFPTVFPVNVKYIPDPAGTITGTPVVCAGTEGVLYHTDSIPGACTYVWTVPPGAFIEQGQWTNEILVNFSDNSQSGTFSVHGNNLCGNGQASPDFAVTVNPLPPTPVIIQSGDTLVSDAPAGNQWFHDHQPIPGANETWYVPGVNGVYSVVVTLDGCPSDTSNAIGFILLENENATGNPPFVIYPNPSKGRFFLTGQDFSGNRAVVYDMRGKKVYDGRIKMNLLDLRELPPGMYLLKINTFKGNNPVKIQITD